MRFVIDQDVDGTTIDLLKTLDHDVVLVKNIGMSRVSDCQLMKEAKLTHRLLVTRDKDYGALAFMQADALAGMVLLRGQPGDFDNVHKTLVRLLQENAENRLRQSFSIVESHRYRIRELSRQDGRAQE
jgi:predicted nuclease of predicted toxin-antitoxin system